jgi:mRNA interferase RelE/StbE
MSPVKTIVLGPGAAKAFDKLDGVAQRQVADALHQYAIRGFGDVKAMVGTNTARLRIGDYRVIFDEEPERVIVLALGHRKDIYR